MHHPARWDEVWNDWTGLEWLTLLTRLWLEIDCNEWIIESNRIESSKAYKGALSIRIYLYRKSSEDYKYPNLFVSVIAFLTCNIERMIDSFDDSLIDSLIDWLIHSSLARPHNKTVAIEKHDFKINCWCELVVVL